MIKYFIITFILIYVIFAIYFKIKNRFWSRQPVFHYHNILYWLFPPGIIEHSPPVLNKFYNSTILFDKYSNIDEKKKNDMFNLIRYHYLQVKDLRYEPSKQSVFSYFQNHPMPCFISLMYKKIPSFDITNKQSIPSNKLISTMTTRSLKCVLDSKEFVLNYVDYLCVHMKSRKQGIAPQIIYTHFVKARHKDKENIIFLFKREGTMTSIVPLTTYYTYGFHIKYWKYVVQKRGNIQNILLTGKNIDIFHHFSKIIQSNCRCFISPNISNLKTLIDKKLIYMFLLLKNSNPIACYVFRNPYTNYLIQEEYKPSIDLVTSYCNKEYITLFIDYFYHCLIQLRKIHPVECLLVENIADNTIIIQNILKKHRPIIKSPTAYYFYNFAYRPILSQNIFLLN